MQGSAKTTRLLGIMTSFILDLLLNFARSMAAHPLITDDTGTREKEDSSWSWLAG